MRTSPLARAGPSDLGGSRAPRGIRAQGWGNHPAGPRSCSNFTSRKISVRGVQKRRREPSARPGDRLKTHFEKIAPGLRPGPRFPPSSLLLHRSPRDKPRRTNISDPVQAGPPPPQIRTRKFISKSHQFDFFISFDFFYTVTQPRGSPRPSVPCCRGDRNLRCPYKKNRIERCDSKNRY